MIPWWIVFASQFLVAAAAAVSTGPSRLRRGVSLALALVVLFLPWLAGDRHPFVGALMGMAALLPVLRWLDLARDRESYAPHFRVWFFLTPFDVRRVEHVRPHLDHRALGSALFHAGVGAAGVALVWSWPEQPLARLLGGTAAVYGLVGGVADAVRTAYALAGLAVPPIQRWPALARSAGEFWGERWNRPVNEWLARHLFWPLARRRHPLVGIAAAFLASAFIHWWIAGVAFGLLSEEAAWMASFFVLQCGIVLIEGPLGVRRWPAAAAHAWTLGVLLLPAALFVEPFVRLLGL